METVPRIAIYNHKGGVGKTTLTVNVAFAFAEQGRRVLLIDADPQCNLTTHLIEESVVDDLLDRSDDPDGQTIWSAVKPLSEATGDVKTIDPVELSTEGVYLIPGDIRLSEFENDLNEFWGQCLQRKEKGFRGTTGISVLVDRLCATLDFDFVLYDSGPNIGPLNRAVLLDCSHFAVPVACDLFSLRALKTLGRTMVEWITEWRTIADLAPSGALLLDGNPQFIGYIPQGFRTYGGEVAQQQAGYLAKIHAEIQSQVVGLLDDVDPELVYDAANVKLGEVKNFGALVPAAQADGSAIANAPTGSQEQRDTAREAFTELADAIIDRTS